MSPDEMIAPRVPWQPARTTRDTVRRLLSSPIVISVMLAVFACPKVPADEPAAVENTGALRITDHDRNLWSFKPPRRSEPAIAGDASWARQPLDRFILARLRERGLEPSPEAPRATFIRRLTLRPDRPAADAGGSGRVPRRRRSPTRSERLVDRLLASPRFGERMASLWLPLARYAEDQAHQVGEDTKFFYPNADRTARG